MCLSISEAFYAIGLLYSTVLYLLFSYTAVILCFILQNESLHPLKFWHHLHVIVVCLMCLFIKFCYQSTDFLMNVPLTRLHKTVYRQSKTLPSQCHG